MPKVGLKSKRQVIPYPDFGIRDYLTLTLKRLIKIMGVKELIQNLER